MCNGVGKMGSETFNLEIDKRDIEFLKEAIDMEAKFRGLPENFDDEEQMNRIQELYNQLTEYETD